MAAINNLLVTNSNVASVTPATELAASSLPVDSSGSASNSSSNLLPATEVASAISPPGPSPAITKEGADLNPPNTALYPACL